MESSQIHIAQITQGISGHLTDAKQGIQRRDIYLARTSGVDVDDYRAIRRGIERILKETRRNLAVQDFGNFNAHQEPFGSADWYQQNAPAHSNKGLGPQVSAVKIDRYLRTEPWQQKPHFDVMAVDKDMNFAENYSGNYIFGYGPYPNTIVSTKRFLSLYPHAAQRHACLAIITAHEFGHNLGLVSRNFNVGEGGYRAGHCNGEKGPCLMEQVNIEGCKDVVEQARALAPADSGKNWLCSDCHGTILQIRKYLENNGVRW